MRYQSIATDLARRIADGTYPPGTTLPGERQLAEDYGVALTTIRKALDAAAQAGLVERRHGAATRVLDRGPVRRVAMDRYKADAAAADSGARETSFTRDHGIDWGSYRLDREFTRAEADVDLAAALEVEPGAPLLRRHFVFHAHGAPAQISTNYLPWDLLEGTAVADPDNEPWPGGTIAQAAHLGHPITRVEESVTARMPTAEEQAVLRMLPDTPVHAIRRRLIAAARVVEVCRDIVLPGDRVILDYAIDL